MALDPAGQRGGHLGVTTPKSLADPTPFDLRLSKKLQDALCLHGVFESEEELAQRMSVLVRINNLVKEWIKDVSRQKNIPENNNGWNVFTYGSYRLGVHTKGADIDTVCVAPRHVERMDFFKSFYELLKAWPNVRNVRAIEGAYIPLIKMEFEGIEVDMVFAQLALPSIPNDLDLRDVSLLKNLDEKSIRSLNGCRVADEILHLVPNKESFRMTLQAIKLWAKKKGIYSKALGYLSGVSCAILVARVCQLFPNFAPARLVCQFFRVFSTWDWPNPVMLKLLDIENPLGIGLWDPRVRPRDRYHLMPIIAPTYPQDNTAYNVTYSARHVIIEEMKEASALVQNIESYKEEWPCLFEPSNFFQKYRHYLKLTVQAEREEHYLEWRGLVESKIRILVGNLERNPFVKLAHVLPEAFGPVSEKEGKHMCKRFIGLIFHNVQELVDLTPCIQAFSDLVHRQATYLNLFKEDMKFELLHVPRKDLDKHVFQEVLHREDKPVREERRGEAVEERGKRNLGLQEGGH